MALLARADTRSTMVATHCAFLTINRYDCGRGSDSPLAISRYRVTRIGTFLLPHWTKNSFVSVRQCAKFDRDNLSKMKKHFPLFFFHYGRVPDTMVSLYRPAGAREGRKYAGNALSGESAVRKIHGGDRRHPRPQIAMI